MPPPRQLRPSPARAPPQRSDPHRGPNAASPPRPPRPLGNRVYVPVKLARRLYADGAPVPWPDINLLALWHLNSRRVPMPPVPREELGARRVLDVYARVYSCRQCWASKCRGSYNSSKFPLSGPPNVYRTQGGGGQSYPSQATLQLRYKKSLVSPTHPIHLSDVYVH
jgi:hypothetical protein